MSDKPIQYTTHCPLGKKRCRVERVIGAGAGFIFKGSGFYATEYRSKEYNEKSKKESPPVESVSKDREPSIKPKTSQSPKE